MSDRSIIWLPSVRKKLLQYRSYRFTPEETLEFISQIVLETEKFLKNPVIGRTYTEEAGDYKGMSRVVIRKFKIYFEHIRDDMVIVAILFPGETS